MLYNISLYGLLYVNVKERNEWFVVFWWTNTCIFCIVDTFVRMLWLLELRWKRSCKKSVLLKTWYFSLNNTSVVFLLLFFNAQLIWWNGGHLKCIKCKTKGRLSNEKIFLKWHLPPKKMSVNPMFMYIYLDREYAFKNGHKMFLKNCVCIILNQADSIESYLCMASSIIF